MRKVLIDFHGHLIFAFDCPTRFTRNNSFVTLSTYVYGVTSKRGAIPPTLRALTTIIFVATLAILVVYNITSGKKKTKRG